MDYLLYLLVIYTFVCGLTDLIYGKVYNIVSISALAAAVIIKIVLFGFSSTVLSVVAGILCFMCYLPLFYFSIVGGGDVKMVFVLGFIAGYNKIADYLFASLVVSALFSLIILFVDGRYKIFFYRLYFFIYSIFHPVLKPSLPKVRNTLKAPIAFALGISAILVYTNVWMRFIRW